MGRKRTYKVTPGQIFSRGTVVREFRGKSPAGRSVWFADVLCQCGNLYTPRVIDLYNGKSKSCGCHHRESSSEHMTLIRHNPNHPANQRGINHPGHRDYRKTKEEN